MAPDETTTSSAPYTVLARRFRPQTFEDVVGQEHVGQAICNAIRTGRVAHAYLFTGARGVGKTSTARIFAKALNCPNTADGVPCNSCEVCQSIASGQDVDVLEIDGASNRGIDDIRQLRANVNVRSMRSKHKVYIIDEVHMLTKEAFNALLKTLEEPPPNVKFIFCTTEPNKVPDTILSRCQRFDFGTIATDRIALRLTQIAEAEGMTVDPEAVELVARRAAGSMRDSQSLFDQLLAFGEEHITTDDVHRLLGTAPDERLVLLVENLITRERGAALNQLEEAVQQGAQLGPFSDQLLEYLRDLLIVVSGANQVPLLSVGNGLRDVLREQGTRWGMHTIAAAMQILAETKGKMQRVNYGRALVELALVRMSLLSDLDDIAQMMQQCRSGLPPTAGRSPVAALPGSSSPGVGPTGSPTTSPGTQNLATGKTTSNSPEISTQGNKLREEMARRLEAKRQREAAQSTSSSIAPHAMNTVVQTPLVQTSVNVAPDVEKQSTPPAPYVKARPPISWDTESQTTNSPAPSSDDSTTSWAPAKDAANTQASEAYRDTEYQDSHEVNRPHHTDSAPFRTAPSDDSRNPYAAHDDGHQEHSTNEDSRNDLNEHNIEAIWGQMLAQANDKLANHLKNAHCPTVTPTGAMAIRFPSKCQFSVTYCQRPESLTRLRELAEQVVGQYVDVTITIDAPTAGSSNTPTTTGNSPRSMDDRLRPAIVDDDPFVQSAVTIFGGTIVDVRKMAPPVEVDHSQDIADDDDVDI
ncbi:MAG: DNA polymerase III subunit gamma/tau [Planctomycetaceae bacterium]